MPGLLACSVLAGCAHTATTPAAAGTSGKPPLLAPERVVHSEVAQKVTAAPGERGELELRLRIAPGYHVMSDWPSNPLYIATQVAFEPQPGLAFESPRYPAPQRFRLGGEDIATFEAEIRVRVPFSVAKDAAPGPRQVCGVLHYQACTRGSCLFPVQQALSASIEITR